MQTNDEILGIKIQKYGLDKEAKPNEKGFYDYKDEAEFTDYSNAISLYKKTFPNKQKVIEETPDPAVSEMLLKMQDMGIETVLIDLTSKNHNAPLAWLEFAVRSALWGHVRSHQRQLVACAALMRTSS